jgi:hypothetical protein
MRTPLEDLCTVLATLLILAVAVRGFRFDTPDASTDREVLTPPSTP